MSTLRCKMRVEKIGHDKDVNGVTTAEHVMLRAVIGNSPENEQWSKWTPNGSLQITITNPSAIGKVLSGHEYYVDFTPVE